MNYNKIILSETLQSIGTAFLILFSVLIAVYFTFVFTLIEIGNFHVSEIERNYFLLLAIITLFPGVIARICGKLYEVQFNNDQSEYDPRFTNSC